MSQPIKIVVTAETAQAAAALQAFVKQTAGGLAEVEAASHGAAGGLNANRMALMEMGHSARSIADGLAAGMSPLRLAMMEAPRLTQAVGEASAEFRAKLMAFLPALGGIAAAVTAGAVLWHYYGDALTDPTKRARELADALGAIPDLLKKIETAQRGGSISPGQAEKYRDLLSGKTPLYNQTTVPDAFGGHAATVKNGLFGLTGEAFPELTTDPFIRNTRTGKVVGTRQLANQTDINTYVKQLQRGNATMANDENNPGDEARAKLADAELKIQRDAELGTTKEIDRIKDRYAIERRELEETRNTAVAAHKWTADDQKKYDDTLLASKTAEAQSIAEIQQKAQDQAFAKDKEEATKAADDNRKIVLGQDEDLAAQILTTRERTKDVSIALYKDEYSQRIMLAQDQYDQGLILEDELKKKVLDAAKERAAGEKEYTAQLERQAQLKMELQRSDAEGVLKQVQDSPFLSDKQKAAGSVYPIERLIGANNSDITAQQNIAANPDTSDEARATALEKINQLKAQNIDLTRQLQQAEGEASYSDNWARMVVSLENMNNLAKETAQTFQTVFNGAINSISQNLTKVIEGTENWHKALLNIAQTVVGSIIQGIIQMGVRWLLTQIMMATMGRAIMAAATAATAPIAAAQAAIWATPATLATIASYGAAAVQAPAMIAIAQAATLGTAGFSEGGYTGNGSPSDVAGFVHRGEFVFSAPAVDRVGIGTLEAMHNGTAAPAGSAVSGGAPGGVLPPKVVTVFDRQSLMRELQSPDYAHVTVQHVMNNKTKIGIRS
jgi:hypothetical protein